MQKTAANATKSAILTKLDIATETSFYLDFAIRDLGDLYQENFTSVTPPEDLKNHPELWYNWISARMGSIYNHLNLLTNILASSLDRPTPEFRSRLEVLSTPWGVKE